MATDVQIGYAQCMDICIFITTLRNKVSNFAFFVAQLTIFETVLQI